MNNLRDPKDVIISDNKTLDKIIDDHQLWIAGECDNWQSMRATLNNLDLRNIDFSEANLSGADFSYSDLSGSNFEDAYIIGVNFNNAHINHCHFERSTATNAQFQHVDCIKSDFTKANLNYAIFNEALLDDCIFDKTFLNMTSFIESDGDNLSFNSADLICTNFTGASCHGVTFGDAYINNVNFSKAFMKDAIFSGATIISTNFWRANINNAHFVGTKIGDNVNLHTIYNPINVKELPNIPLVCPEKGSFIGYKIGICDTLDFHYCLIELEILKTSKRSSGKSRICRCDKAKVLDIIDIKTNKHIGKCVSYFYRDFEYKVGKISRAVGFDKNRWRDAADGIHFFMSKQEALDYAKELLYDN